MAKTDSVYRLAVVISTALRHWGLACCIVLRKLRARCRSMCGSHTHNVKMSMDVYWSHISLFGQTPRYATLMRLSTSSLHLSHTTRPRQLYKTSVPLYIHNKKE